MSPLCLGRLSPGTPASSHVHRHAQWANQQIYSGRSSEWVWMRFIVCLPMWLCDKLATPLGCWNAAAWLNSREGPRPYKIMMRPQIQSTHEGHWSLIAMSKRHKTKELIICTISKTCWPPVSLEGTLVKTVQAHITNFLIQILTA